MAEIVAGMASSHAFAFWEPEQWDKRRAITRGTYAKRYGQEPPIQPQVADESLEENQERYNRTIRHGLQQLRARLHELKPDALVIIGDDQDENFKEELLPQFAIYTGEEYEVVNRDNGERSRHTSDAELAQTILRESVEAGFDLVQCGSFPSEKLISHAHQQVINYMEPSMPVVPIFVNAIHVPAPTPKRCYDFGKTLRTIVEQIPGSKRVAFYASGGLSHFTAGYPWKHYQGPYTLGGIGQDFDRRALEWMSTGRGSELATLSSRDLMENGDIEMRQWIVLQGVLGSAKPELLMYEPFYRGLLGMSVGYWDLQGASRPMASDRQLTVA